MGANGTLSSETVWNAGAGATGGGVSDFFALPSFQQSGFGSPNGTALITSLGSRKAAAT